jgi:hypothetical protein
MDFVGAGSYGVVRIGGQPSGDPAITASLHVLPTTSLPPVPPATQTTTICERVRIYARGGTTVRVGTSRERAGGASLTISGYLVR